MLKKIIDPLQSPTAGSLAKAFTRSGKLGFWVQVILGSIPIVLMGYNFMFARSPVGPRAGLPVVEYLVLASLLILIFTTFWFWRYIRLGATLADPAARPSQSSLIRTVWTGLMASSLGVLVSLVVMKIEVGHLLFYFLSAPQGGVPVVQAAGVAPASWVSAVDMLSLMALLLTLAAEIIVLVLGLWLLFRSSQLSKDLA
ncbi:MAG: DUF3611 family protein [Chromatiaceae bacterium]|jgi:hypothetical protein|nr:DUF3611 family protein [Chromatiaceae bacterium]